MKTEKSSKETKEILSKLSKVINDDTSSDDILWDLTAKKIDATLRKVKLMAELGELHHYSKDLESDINALMKKCRDAEFQIAVVGVMKAGKSFLMNALIGAEIASVEVNPETAALTKFRSASGYYVKVKFHNKDEWQKLKASVNSTNLSDESKKRDSFAARLNNPNLKEIEKKYIGKELNITCKSLEELREQVRIYTSSNSLAHILVSEIEVGIDRSIFNMPKEVVFVDTPGLKDPVKYRSDITEKYIKQANAVLVALKPGPFTAEGIEIVNSVLDKTDKEKTIIVGTQKDLRSENDCVKYVSNWKEKLIEAKQYEDEMDVSSRIVLTSAKMELLVKKWDALTIEQKRNPKTSFVREDYSALKKYAEDVLDDWGIDLSNLSNTDNDRISNATGIPALRRKLETTLIDNYRKLKVKDIVKTYERCRNELIKFGNNTIKGQEGHIANAKMDIDMMKTKIAEANKNKAAIDAQTNSLKQEAERIINSVREKINSSERKVW